MIKIGETALRLRVLHRAWRMRVRSDSAQVRFILRHLRPGDVAVDVGSHKGGFTYWMRKAVGPVGMVYAFELQPRSASYQREIVGAFKWKNVLVETLASRRTASFSAFPGGFHPGGRLDSDLDRPFLIFESERHRHSRQTIRPILDSLLALGYSGGFIQGSRLVDLKHFDEQKHQSSAIPEVNNFAFWVPSLPSDPTMRTPPKVPAES